MSEETKISLPAIYGVKAGMTRIFDETGKHVPVTVVKLIPNVISQVKTQEKDGYTAYQVAYGEKREKLVVKPLKGHLAKSGTRQTFTKFSEIFLIRFVKSENCALQAILFLLHNLAHA